MKTRDFYFTLAVALNCTVKELLQNFSSRELSEWEALYRLSKGKHDSN